MSKLTDKQQETRLSALSYDFNVKIHNSLVDYCEDYGINGEVRVDYIDSIMNTRFNFLPQAIQEQHEVRLIKETIEYSDKQKKLIKTLSETLMEMNQQASTDIDFHNLMMDNNDLITGSLDEMAHEWSAVLQNRRIYSK